MSWDITLLTVHILLAMGAGRLFCSAPDWLQKLVLFNVIVAGLVLTAHYAMKLFGIEFYYSTEMKLVAFSFEHVGVLLYVGRLFMVENHLCKTSLQRSRHYPA